MRAYAALLQKEFAHHLLALTGLTLLLALAFVIYWWQLDSGARVLTYLSLVSSFAKIPIVLAALYLGHRLVVLEYYGKTQHFVETLPISIGQMELTKFMFGFVYLGCVNAAILAASVALSVENELVESRFLAIMTVRLVAYVFALWSFVFCMGFLGRLRIPLYVLVALGVAAIDYYTKFEVSRFGPLALIDGATFAFERRQFPTPALIESAVVGSVFFVLAFALARTREGSLVEQLAQPMSQRERGFFATCIVCVVLAWSWAADKAQRAPFEFTSEHVLRSRSGSIEIGYFRDDARRVAQQQLNFLDARVDPMWQALQLGEMAPKVRIALSSSAHTGRFETTHEDPLEGIVVEADFLGGGDRKFTDLSTYVVHEILAAHSKRRASIESKHWFLDGFSRYWTLHGASTPDRLGTRFEGDVLHALVASRKVAVNVDRIREWDLVMEGLGYPMADAFAYLGLRVLADRRGVDAVMNLARTVLARTPHIGVMDLWYERRNTMADVFESSTGGSWPQFVEAWSNSVERLRGSPAYTSALERVPRGVAQFRNVRHAAGSDLVVAVRLQPAPSPAPTLGDTCTFSHTILGPVDTPIDIRNMQWEERLWPAQQSDIEHIQPTPYGEGSRMMVAVDCDFAALGIPIRMGVERMVLP